MEKATKESIVQRLKEAGLKATPQRLAVIEAFMELKGFHPGAGLVYEKAKKKKKSLSLSTVYAALNELSRLGIIKTIQFDQRENRYEGNLEEHVNLICGKCGRITDYNDQIIIDLKEVAKRTDFLITGTRLEYYGYCSECRKVENKTKGP